MNHLPVTSSLIKSVGYNEEERRMQVSFHNGSTYEYANVPLHAYGDFIASASVGKHFNDNISGRYDHKRL